MSSPRSSLGWAGALAAVRARPRALSCSAGASSRRSASRRDRRGSGVLISLPSASRWSQVLRLLADSLAQLLEAAVGCGAHGTGALAEDAGGGGGVEAEHRAQHDGLGLVAGQGADQRDDGLGADLADDVALDVDVVGQVHEVIDRSVDHRPAPGVPEVVEGAVTADGGDPPAEAVGVAAEPVQVAEGLRPRLAGDVLGLSGTDQDGEVAHERWLDVAVDDAGRP